MKFKPGAKRDYRGLIIEIGSSKIVRLLTKYWLVWLKVFVLVYMVGLVNPLSEYMKSPFGEVPNANNVLPGAWLVPLVAVTIVSIAVATAALLIARGRLAKASFIGTFVMLFTFNYAARMQFMMPVLKSLSPFMDQPLWVYSLTLLAILFAIGAIIFKLLSGVLQSHPSILNRLYVGLLAAVGYVFLASALPAVIYAVSTIDQANYRPPALASNVPETAKSADKPDIYYIVLDRYTNSDNLKNQLGFDNQPFLKGLKSQGFYVSNSAHSVYPYTAMSIGSTMTAGFLDDLHNKFGDSKNQTFGAIYNLTQYGSVPAEFKKLGYSYNVIGSRSTVSDKAPLADVMYYDYATLRVGDKTKKLDEFDNSQFSNSPLAPFAQSGINGFTYSTQSAASAALYQLDTLEDLANSKQQGGRFIFAHILVPHDPFVFNGDGSISQLDPGYNDFGRPVEQKYIQQIEFINSAISKVVSQVIANSKGKALIVMQSDEGYYPQNVIDKKSDTEVSIEVSIKDMRGWSDEYLRAKYGILAAYRLPGVNNDELKAGANSANVFRLVLNHYFGYQLPLLPKCNFGLVEGTRRPFDFADITARLSASPDPACKTVYGQ